VLKIILFLASFTIKKNKSISTARGKI